MQLYLVQIVGGDDEDKVIEEVTLTDVLLKLNELCLQEFLLVFDDVQFLRGGQVDHRAIFEESPVALADASDGVAVGDDLGLVIQV